MYNQAYHRNAKRRPEQDSDSSILVNHLYGYKGQKNEKSQEVQVVSGMIRISRLLQK